MIRTTFGMHNVKSIRVSFSQSPEGTSWMEFVLNPKENLHVPEDHQVL